MRVLLDECLPKKLKVEVDADIVKRCPKQDGRANRTVNC